MAQIKKIRLTMLFAQYYGTLYQEKLLRCAPESRFQAITWGVEGSGHKRTAASMLVLVTNVLYTTDVFITRLIVNRILLDKFYFKLSREAVI